MSHFGNFVVISNALRVFLILAIAHPAMAGADIPSGMEQPVSAPAIPSKAPSSTMPDIGPGSAPVGVGWG
jgi:hypothetical protein